MIRYLIAGIALLSMLPVEAFAQIKADLQIVKDCTNAPSNEALGLADGPGQQAKLANFNVRCDHQRLLKEGNNIHAVFMLQMRKKADLVEAACYKDIPKKDIDPKAKCAMNSSDLDHFREDNTCLKEVPGQQLAEDGDECFRRLMRAATDAAVATRKTVLNNNKARTELVSDKDSLHLCDNNKQSNDPNTKDCIVQSPELKKDTVLKDLNEANKASRDPKNAARQLYKLLGTSNVTFGVAPSGPQSGDAILNADSESSQAAESKKISEINDSPGLAQTLSETGALDRGSVKEDAAMAKGLDDAKTTMGAKYKKDQERANKVVGALPKNVPPKDPPVGASMQAFQQTMDELSDSAKKKGGLGATQDEVNTRDASISYSGEGIEKGKQSQDKTIIDMLRDPASSSQ